ncbi:MAG: sigma 54-interacting transcriptional regulator [Deltaproteobacteria bacterium]|jgi:transcriptional regulator with PAS, ATPase and Fis domain|nr:sigma 54-interacting transcriptional regulator [Deltaproteobacteria bacterium]
MATNNSKIMADVESIGTGDQITKAWQAIVLDHKPTDIAVRKHILESWHNCLKLNVDPLTPPKPKILTQSQLNKLLESNAELIQVAKPVMEMLEISVRGTGFIATLTEKNGYVLIVQGDHDVLAMAQRSYYLPGCLRSSKHAGTNAISLSLENGIPIQLTGAEHYNINHHKWTCSSSPVRDREGNIIAAITLSGGFSRKHEHTLALVKAATANIESQLRERELVEQSQRLNYMLTSIYNSVSDGIIATDHLFNITHLNAAAIKMIGIDEGSVRGKPLRSLLVPENNLLSSMEKGDNLEAAEITFRLPNGSKSYICNVDPIHTGTFKLLGSIVTMAEQKKMINIAKKIGGNYSKYEFSDIIGRETNFLHQVKMAKIAAKTNSRVLIMGESGTGKELFAQSIHSHSHRSNGPFVAISCAAIPRDLIESELFGYTGGAFTGARSKGMIGKFELANAGTLFLDEINGLPLQLQGKLLRVLQQNEIMRLGDNRNIPVDVRVIAASNADLVEEVEQGHFREDLYYRLNVMEIFIPPLRERMDDIERLIEHILHHQSQKLAIPKPGITSQALNYIKSYDFPGNVRELENLIERAMLLCQGKRIEKDHLMIRPRRTGLSPYPKTKTVKDQYRNIIVSALNQHDGNVSKAARNLKIARSTLYRKMREFGIE